MSVRPGEKRIFNKWGPVILNVVILIKTGSGQMFAKGEKRIQKYVPGGP